jgi:hypothetical protein
MRRGIRTSGTRRSRPGQSDPDGLRRGRVKEGRGAGTGIEEDAEVALDAKPVAQRDEAGNI